ncbi:MAG: hypothetical protein LBI61_01935 [Puniceicoccales bacterium]|jgi:hypothetical protein|nr:hypothetical protein [Puniceicoccales bacterium]
MWTLKYNDSVGSLSSFGVADLRRIRKNLLTDRVTFRVDGDSLLSLPTFTANAPLEIFYGDSRWFAGIITQTPLHCSPGGEEYTYEVSGGWWYLENLIFQQAWKEPIDPTASSPTLGDVYKSRVILGQDLSSARITIGEQIADVVSYAISCGANLAIGNIDIPVLIPFDECKDLSCADVIRRLLRWVPDTVYRIDYASAVPEISFLRRSQMAQVSVNLSTSVEEFSIQPRYDLQIPAVVLKFEITNATNGKTWKESIAQKHPIDCTGTELKAIVLTINLEGSKANYVIQNIVTEPIDTSSVSWWKAHVPSMGNIPSESISVGGVSRTSSLPNELISGNVANWMDQTTQTDVVRCKISYADASEAIVDREVAVRIIATDATSGTYKKLTSLATAETVPENLAEQIYAAVNPLQYDGYVVTVSSEIGEDYFGKVLNISGAQPVWETMGAVIQEVSEWVDSGKILVKFGPAKHLGAADLAELTRSGRLLFESRNYNERITAEATGNGAVEQGIYSRVDNTSFGTGKYKMIKFVDPANSGKSVQIDASDMETVVDAAVKFREEDVCESGILKKRYSLASEPYTT